MMTIRPISALTLVPQRDGRTFAERNGTPAPDEDVRVIDNALKFSRVSPDASVVAQLMATHLDAPQTRRLRRIDAQEGAAVYRATRDDIARGKREATPLPSWTA
jgi:hypothetical protein